MAGGWGWSSDSVSAKERTLRHIFLIDADDAENPQMPQRNERHSLLRKGVTALLMFSA